MMMVNTKLVTGLDRACNIKYHKDESTDIEYYTYACNQEEDGVVCGSRRRRDALRTVVMIIETGKYTSWIENSTSILPNTSFQGYHH